MRWELVIGGGEIAVYFEATGLDEDAAYALGLEKIRAALKDVKGVSVRPSFRKIVRLVGTPDPDPRD